MIEKQRNPSILESFYEGIYEEILRDMSSLIYDSNTDSTKIISNYPNESKK